MDPSGTYVQYDAKAIGSGSEGAQQSLQEAYHKVMRPSSYSLLLFIYVMCFNFSVYDNERSTEVCSYHL